MGVKELLWGRVFSLQLTNFFRPFMGVESLRQQTHLESHPKIKKRQETVACSMRVVTTWPSSWTRVGQLLHVSWGILVTEWQLGNCTDKNPERRGDFKIQEIYITHYVLSHNHWTATSTDSHLDPFAVLQAHLDICTVTLQHHSPSLLALELWNWRLFILGRQLVK